MSSALVQNYARIDIAFEQGEGSHLIAENGKRYLDFTCGIGVTSLGHSNARVTNTLKEQADKVWHVSNLYNIEPQAQLAERLTTTSFADRAFFCNSGGEAVEAALKMARIFHSSRGDKERYRVLTFANAFHGRTLATISAGGQAKHLEGFGPRVDGFDQVRLNDLDAVKAAIGPATAAILIEPVQGEGGVHVADAVFLKGLRALCDANEILLIYDEIQCGMGRTGKLWAYEWSGVAPDILTAAKALGNGFPIGAVLATEAVAETLVPGKHGTTFGGNPLATSVANAVLQVLRPPNARTVPRHKFSIDGAAHVRRAHDAVHARYGDMFTIVRVSRHDGHDVRPRWWYFPSPSSRPEAYVRARHARSVHQVVRVAHAEHLCVSHV